MPCVEIHLVSDNHPGVLFKRLSSWRFGKSSWCMSVLILGEAIVSPVSHPDLGTPIRRIPTPKLDTVASKPSPIWRRLGSSGGMASGFRLMAFSSPPLTPLRGLLRRMKCPIIAGRIAKSSFFYCGKPNPLALAYLCWETLSAGRNKAWWSATSQVGNCPVCRLIRGKFHPIERSWLGHNGRSP